MISIYKLSIPAVPRVSATKLQSLGIAVITTIRYAIPSFIQLLPFATMQTLIVAEKIKIILKFVAYTLATGFLGSITLVVLAFQAERPNRVVIGCWFGLSTLNFIARYLAFVKTRAMAPADRISLSTKAWIHTFLSGCIWGLAAFLFLPTLPAMYQATFAIVLLGLNITSIPLMSDVRGITCLFLPAWLPTAYRLYEIAQAPVVPLAILFMLACVYLVAFIIRNTLDEFIKVRLERDQALVELNQTNATQMSFFLAASHDFRQPLHSMSYYLMTLKEYLTDQAKEAIDIGYKLQETFEKLEHLIDETVGFAKISLGIEQPTIETISTKSLAESLNEGFRHSAEAKRLSFRTYAGKDYMLNVDIPILRRILDNLISNALRNTIKGGILVTFRKQEKMCRIQVWDTGLGIPEYETERVFDAFYQCPQRKNSSHKGYGLGLMIVKRLSERIGAELTLMSRVGQGTVFSITLPLFSTPVPFTIKKTVSDRKQIHGVQLDGYTIALVDDDASIRDSVGNFLAKTGAKLIVASGRDHLLSELEAADHLSLLLTDLHLFNDLGDDIAAEIHLRYPAVKSIIMTGDISKETQTRLRMKGFNVLLKPFPGDRLLEKILSILNVPLAK